MCVCVCVSEFETGSSAEERVGIVEQATGSSRQVTVARTYTMPGSDRHSGRDRRREGDAGGGSEGVRYRGDRNERRCSLPGSQRRRQSWQ